MYNLFFEGALDEDVRARVIESFGEKYDLTDDPTQANVVVTDGNELSDELISSKLVFAVVDLSVVDPSKSTSSKSTSPLSAEALAERGIVLFRTSGDSDNDEIISLVAAARGFIEDGNINGSPLLPDVSLGEFGDDVSRVSILMKGIDEPILLGAMMFSGLDLYAVAGGTNSNYGYALVSSREPVTRVPHVDGVLKVRVIQDI